MLPALGWGYIEYKLQTKGHARLQKAGVNRIGLVWGVKEKKGMSLRETDLGKN